MGQELLDDQAGFRKSRGTRDQIFWIIEKAREFQKNIHFYLVDYTKAFDCVDHKLWEILEEMRLPNHVTCLLRKLSPVWCEVYKCVGQEATVRTRHGTMKWFKIGKGV